MKYKLVPILLLSFILSSGAILFAADTEVILLDIDNDGVIDQLDQCPDTPENSYVNKFGCTELQKTRLNESKPIEENVNRGPNKSRMTINRTEPLRGSSLGIF